MLERCDQPDHGVGVVGNGLDPGEVDAKPSGFFNFTGSESDLVVGSQHGSIVGSAWQLLHEPPVAPTASSLQLLYLP